MKKNRIDRVKEILQSKVEETNVLQVGLLRSNQTKEEHSQMVDKAKAEIITKLVILFNAK